MSPHDIDLKPFVVDTYFHLVYKSPGQPKRFEERFMEQVRRATGQHQP